MHNMDGCNRNPRRERIGIPGRRGGKYSGVIIAVARGGPRSGSSWVMVLGCTRIRVLVPVVLARKWYLLVAGYTPEPARSSEVLTG